MDSRFLELFSRQLAAGFPGLAGSGVTATIRISADLAGPAIAASGKLPQGVRLDEDRVFVDVRTRLQPFGQGRCSTPRSRCR
jgi:hypothetical protein